MDFPRKENIAGLDMEDYQVILTHGISISSQGVAWESKNGKKKEWYFSVRDRKYPTGLRTNRATDAGYWKTIGNDKEIFRGKSLVGMRTTLVFYEGRAPKGDKTNWVMQEYRLEGYSRNQEEIIDFFDNPLLAISSNPSDIFPSPPPPLPNSYLSQATTIPGNVQYSTSLLMQDQPILRALLESHGSKHEAETETREGDISFSQEMCLRNDINTVISSAASNLELGKRPLEDQHIPSTSVGPAEFDSFWNY